MGHRKGWTTAQATLTFIVFAGLISTPLVFQLAATRLCAEQVRREAAGFGQGGSEGGEDKLLEAGPSEVRGTDGHVIQAAVVANVTRCPPIAVEEVLVLHGNRELHNRSFGRCALVGSSDVISGLGHGSEIDNHDTIIRVNRLPHGAYIKDFGKRTTFYFKNFLGDWNGTHVEVVYMHKGWQDPIYCDLRSRGGGCDSFDSLLLEGSVHTKPWKEQLNLVVPVSHQSQQLQYFQHNVGMLHPFKFSSKTIEGTTYSVRPSGGAKAFFTFALLCDSLRLYGFGGHGTADGHGMAKDGGVPKGRMRQHNYESEHSLYADLAAGRLRQKDFPENFLGILREEFASFSERLSCLGKAGLLSIA